MGKDNNQLNVNVNAQVREMLRMGFTLDQAIESLELSPRAIQYVRTVFADGYRPVSIDELVESYSVDCVGVLHQIATECLDNTPVEKMVRIKAAKEVLEMRKNLTIEKQVDSVNVGGRLVDMFDKLNKAIKANEAKMVEVEASSNSLN